MKKNIDVFNLKKKRLSDTKSNGFLFKFPLRRFKLQSNRFGLVTEECPIK